jgi:uncharacterized protein (DUF934 family)
MTLLKDGELIEDLWVAVDDEPLPQGSDVIVPFARLETAFEELKTHNGKLGVAFPNNRPVEELAPYLEALDVVALTFPAFADGRAYSQCRALRSRFGFDRELRATGNILPDQLAFMRNCGFDAFEVSDRHGRDIWQRAAQAMTVAYQRDFVPQHGFAPSSVLEARREKYK